jgi:hypothetical protein
VPSSRRPGRRLLAIVGGAAAAVLAGTALLSVAPRQVPVPSRSSVGPVPAIRSTPLALFGDTEERHRQQFALEHLFATPANGDLMAYLRTHLPGAVSTSLIDAVGGRATGSHSFDLGTLHRLSSPVDLDVFLTCDRGSAYRWTLSSEGQEHDDPVSLEIGGPNCSGHVMHARLRLDNRRMPTRLTVEVPPRVRVLTAVAVSRATPGAP